MLSELIQVVTTTAEKNDAQAIASLLVERRLAACTQVSGPLDSSYWWNDRIETAHEWQVVVKTRGDLYAAVEAAIREAHSYDEPEILALPVVGVSAGYRAWLLAQLAIPPKQIPQSKLETDETKRDKLTESALTRSKRSKPPERK
jgi:periplasmic divalent cation tolerance protein